MYIAKLRLNILLSTKASTGEEFRIVVGIKLMSLDDGTRRWGHMGEIDFRMPTGGNFRKEGADMILEDVRGNEFARLTRGGMLLRAGSDGAIYLAEGAKKYSSGVLQGRGTGKWTCLDYQTEKSITMETLRNFGNNFTQFGTCSDWYVSGCWGFTAGGAAGRSMEYMNGFLEFSNELRPSETPVVLHYEAIGTGYGKKGGGAGYSAAKMPSKGSYVVFGPVATGKPFHPRMLAGPCAIVDGAAGFGAKIPIPKTGAKLPGAGGGAVTMFLFGTTMGAFFHAYKAGAVTVGMSLGAGTSGFGAAVNLCIGSMSVE